jgi:hypothetical protein
MVQVKINTLNMFLFRNHLAPPLAILFQSQNHNRLVFKQLTPSQMNIHIALSPSSSPLSLWFDYSFTAVWLLIATGAGPNEPNLAHSIQPPNPITVLYHYSSSLSRAKAMGNRARIAWGHFTWPSIIFIQYVPVLSPTTATARGG